MDSRFLGNDREDTDSHLHGNDKEFFLNWLIGRLENWVIS